MTFWKRQSYGENEKVSGCQGVVGRGRAKQAEHRGFLGQWKYSNGGYIPRSPLLLISRLLQKVSLNSQHLHEVPGYLTLLSLTLGPSLSLKTAPPWSTSPMPHSGLAFLDGIWNCSTSPPPNTDFLETPQKDWSPSFFSLPWLLECTGLGCICFLKVVFLPVGWYLGCICP